MSEPEENPRGPLELALVANTRLPSQRAQALQVVQSAAAFARAGCATCVWHARRRARVALPPGVDVFAYYGVPAGPLPRLEAVDSVDWIETVPAQLQYLPARLQEASFSSNAARAILARAPHALVLSREIECALVLARAGHARLLLEIHRVPAGATRRRWLREAASHARGVIAISCGVREDLLALGLDPERVRVEHDALEPARFASLPSRASARERLGVPLDAQLVVYTGGLLAWKGVDVLLESARALPRVRFVVAGGMDEDVRALRSRFASVANARLDGFQPPERVPLYLAAADIGVVPNRSSPPISARYTSPLKVFEAFAAGLPLVASDLPSIRELVEHGRDAWLVAPDDPRALAEGIASLLADGALRRAMSERLRSRAPEHTWDARARRILEWAAPGWSARKSAASERRS